MGVKKLTARARKERSKRRRSKESAATAAAWNARIEKCRHLEADIYFKIEPDPPKKNQGDLFDDA